MNKRKIHPNKWFLDICPKVWYDKDFFIEQTCLKALIHFWEDEEGEASIRYQYETDYEASSPAEALKYEQRKQIFREVYNDLLAAYNYAKTVDGDFDETPEEAEVRTHHLMNIIKHRGHLWT